MLAVSVLLCTLLAVSGLSIAEACDGPWFGTDCKYRCRCDGSICNEDGECINDGPCQVGWFGPACQYVDLAQDATVLALPAGSQTGSLTDGNDNTCLYIPDNVQTINLTWTEPFVFTWLRVYVRDSELAQNFKVQFINYNYIKTDCTDPRNATQKGNSLDVYCNLESPAKSLIITLDEIKSLCSVYVSGGRNVALKERSTQSSTSDEFGPERAVDGNTNSNLKVSCTHTAYPWRTTYPTWSLLFSQPILLTRVKLYNRMEDLKGCCPYRLKGFILTGSMDGNEVINYKDMTAMPQLIYTVTPATENTVVSNFTVQATYYDTNENAGYILSLCEVEVYGDSVCEQGHYGRNCEQTCNCEGECFVSTGGCPRGCPQGYQGENCLDCNKHLYGDKCDKKCSSNCTGDSCHKTDGTCYGCVDGKTGLFCDQACERGLYGRECGRNCTDKCEDDGGSICNPTNGICNARCHKDYNGTECLIVPPESPSVGPIVGAVIGCIVLVILVVIGVILWRRWRLSKPAVSLPFRRNENRSDSKDGTKYSYSRKEQNIKKVPHSKKEPNMVAVRKKPAPPGEQTEDISSSSTETNKHYYSELDTSTKIALQDLNDFMASHDKKFFHEQFADLPENAEATMKEGLSSENKNKNINRNICAYDHSRVHLHANKNKKHGNYFNASYVESYNTDGHFIASQGPTRAVLKDFVRMLWEQKVEKVVMLTNLVEEGKLKCERYWPEDDKMEVGEITIELATTQVFADYTIRKLHMSKVGELEQSFTHFHFTSWPDKVVLIAPWGLVDFEERVTSSPSNKPMVVHCSDGVGRTGTFISLLNIIKQAQDTGYLDFFTTVQKLRLDRVNMVQTAEQYEFLHRSAQVAMLCLGTTVTSSGIKDRITKLSLPTDSGYTKMEEEFHAISRLCNGNENKVENEDTRKDATYNVYENSKTVANHTKNRFCNILPNNFYRVPLAPDRTEVGDYINAVHVPSFTKKDQQILTQLPLPTTVVDFWRMVVQQNVSLIVSFNADLDNDPTVGEFLPQRSDEIKTITNLRIQIEPGMIHDLCKQQKVNITTRGTGRMESVSVFNKLKGGSHELLFISTKTELDPKSMLSIVTNIRSLTPRNENRTLYMCRNGADISGLVYVLSLLFDRMDSDHCLTVPLVVGAIKAIRPQVIPTFKQYKLLYDVLNLYLSSMNAYDVLDPYHSLKIYDDFGDSTGTS